MFALRSVCVFISALSLHVVSGEYSGTGEMLQQINNFRAQNGRGKMYLDYRLMKAAQLHSDDQARYGVMTHNGMSSGMGLGDRITAQQFSWSKVAENVAAGQTSVSQVMTSWINSSGHRANLLGNYNCVGIGYTYSSNTKRAYWTQDFGSLKSGTCVYSGSSGTGQTSAPTQSLTCNSIQSNIDYIGYDIGSARSSSVNGCCSLCKQKSGCRAYTWTMYNGGTCWLKSGKGTTKSVGGVYSGTLGASTSSSNSNCSAMQSNVDYYGYDIGSVRSSSASGCCSACKQKSGCRAYTWTKYNGGTCWLKSDKGSTRSTYGAYSGVLQ